jgi:hypothetical protein
MAYSHWIRIVRGVLVALALVAAGCAQLPPHPREAEAKQFTPITDKAVIYLVRPGSGAVYSAPVMLDDAIMGSTYPGTFFRWEVAPGRHRIAGFAGDGGLIHIDTAAGQVYFVSQSTVGLRGLVFSSFQLLDPGYGRMLVDQSALMAISG